LAMRHKRKASRRVLLSVMRSVSRVRSIIIVRVSRTAHASLAALHKAVYFSSKAVDSTAHRISAT